MVWGQTCFSIWGEVLLSHPRKLVLSRGICWRTTHLHRYPLLWASPQPCHSVTAGIFIPAGHMSENRTQILDVQSRPPFPSDSETCVQGVWSYDCLQFREPVPFFSFEDLFIYIWLCWVFIAAHGLSLVAVRGLLIAVASLVAEHKL